MERTISFMNGKGSIGHNTRSFIADNVDASRTKNNITLIHEDIKQVYHKLFDKALDEYNAKQKRKDRQIKSYYEKISRSKQEKLFYEVIVQIGNKDDTGVGSSAAEVATWVLKDYVKMFQLRNPQLYVIGAYIHLDEETPNGSSGQRQRRMILPLSCVGMGLTGRRKTRTIHIYPYWIIRSRSGQRKWLFLRRNWKAHRLFLN